jgi:hypothetical protein
VRANPCVINIVEADRAEHNLHKHSQIT